MAKTEEQPLRDSLQNSKTDVIEIRQIVADLLKCRLGSQDAFVGHFTRGCMFYLIIAGLIFNFAYDKKLSDALLNSIAIVGIVWGLLGLVMCVACNLAVKKLDEDVSELNRRLGSPLKNPDLYFFRWAVGFCACFDIGFAILMLVRLLNF